MMGKVKEKAFEKSNIKLGQMGGLPQGRHGQGLFVQLNFSRLYIYYPRLGAFFWSMLCPFQEESFRISGQSGMQVYLVFAERSQMKGDGNGLAILIFIKFLPGSFLWRSKFPYGREHLRKNHQHCGILITREAIHHALKRLPSPSHSHQFHFGRSSLTLD